MTLFYAAIHRFVVIPRVSDSLCGIVKDLAQGANSYVHGIVLADMTVRLRSHLAGQGRLQGQCRHRIRHAGYIQFVDEKAGFAGEDGFLDAAMTCADHWQACSTCLEDPDRSTSESP